MRKPLTQAQLQELKKRGAEIEKNPLKESILFQLEYLNRWTPPENQKGN
jgi:hypothetical protein